MTDIARDDWAGLAILADRLATEHNVDICLYSHVVHPDNNSPTAMRKIRDCDCHYPGPGCPTRWVTERHRDHPYGRDVVMGMFDIATRKAVHSGSVTVSATYRDDGTLDDLVFSDSTGFSDRADYHASTMVRNAEDVAKQATDLLRRKTMTPDQAAIWQRTHDHLTRMDEARRLRYLGDDDLEEIADVAAGLLADG